MKKHLILTVVMFVVLAIGIGVGRAFSQAEEAKAPAKSADEHDKGHAKHAEPVIAKPVPSVAESQSKTEHVSHPPAAAQPVSEHPETQTATAPSQGKGLSSLLYPERRGTQENPLTEDGIVSLYTELQLEAKGNNTTAIERHAELRVLLERYLESRNAPKSETAALNTNDKPAQ